MSASAEFTTMTCVRCGKTKVWGDGFPNRLEAVCWRCAWNQHIHDEHPAVVRRIKRAARRRARHLAERDLRDVMVGDELMQAFGTEGDA